jgi:hypothetical protein
MIKHYMSQKLKYCNMFLTDETLTTSSQCCRASICTMSSLRNPFFNLNKTNPNLTKFLANSLISDHSWPDLLVKQWLFFRTWLTWRMQGDLPHITFPCSGPEQRARTVAPPPVQLHSKSHQKIGKQNTQTGSIASKYSYSWSFLLWLLIIYSLHSGNTKYFVFPKTSKDFT